MGEQLALGKIEAGLLDRLLRGLAMDGRVTLGPGSGRDAAVIEMADRFLVVASDPISFAGERIGHYAVHVNANDVACLGAEPRWFLATILLPPDSDAAFVEAIFDDLRAACREVGASLVGGHTEVTTAVSRAVVAGTMVGEVGVEGLRLSTAAQPGDALIQVGAVAIEGVAVLAREAAPALRAAGLSDEEIASAASLLFDPGISVLAPARAAWQLPGIHSLHDPTEGGIATACWEVAEAAGLGLTVFEERVLLHPLTERVATALRLDWRGLLASGTLLVTVAGDAAEEALRQLDKSGYEASIIGRMGAAGEPAIIQARGESRALPRFARDEVARVLADSL